MNSKKFLLLVAVIASVLSTAGCNTIEGMGKDIKKAGEKIEESAS